MGTEDRFAELQRRAIALEARSAQALRKSAALRAVSADLLSQAAERRARHAHARERFLRAGLAHPQAARRNNSHAGGGEDEHSGALSPAEGPQANAKQAQE